MRLKKLNKILVTKMLIVLSLVIVETVPFGCPPDTFCTLYPVYAQSSTSSGSTIQEKLKSLQNEIASRAAKLKIDVNKKLMNKAYVGVIKSKSDTSLTLATKSGSKVVNLNEYTLYSGENKATFKTLAVDDYVAALGDVDETEVLTAKKVIRLGIPTITDKNVIGGMVTAVNANSVIIKSYSGETVTIALDSKTRYKFGKSDTTSEAIKVNKAILAVTTGNNKKARYVYIIPYTTTAPKPTPATASASPTTKPKVSPSPTKKP